MRAAALPMLLLVVALLHLAGQRACPEPVLYGDELHYLKQARQDLRSGETGLLPGQLRFSERPELYSRVLARFLQGGEGEGEAKLTAAPAPEVFARVTRAQLALLLAVLVLVHRQARALGLGRPAAFAAAAALGLFPWFGFYVQALWPELLHAAWFGLTLCGLIEWERGRRVAWLLPTGLALGAALLTKGTLSGFVPVLVAWVGWSAWRGRDGAAPGPRGALIAVGLLGLAALAVTGPQLAANHGAGHGLRLSANRWWNLELGLVKPMVEVGEPAPEEGEERIRERFKGASKDPVERDAASRERTLAHLRATGWSQVPRQIRKTRYLLFERASSFEECLDERGRWGAPAPSAVVALRMPARALWYGMLLLGLLGIGLSLSRGAVWWLLALFAGFVLAGVFVIPTKTRFLMPLMPVLALGLGAVVERLVGRGGSAGQDDAAGAAQAP